MITNKNIFFQKNWLVYNQIMHYRVKKRIGSDKIRLQRAQSQWKLVSLYGALHFVKKLL